MARFTRAEIRRIIGEGCTDEMETALLELHHGIVDTVKDELDEAKAKAEKAAAEAEKVAELQKQLEEAKSGEDFKAKYEQEHQAYEAYKQQIADGEALKAKQAAYRKLLADEHISEKRMDAVIRLTDFSKIKLNKEGGLEDVDALKKAIAEDWGEYKVTIRQRGAEVANPPQHDNGGKPMSRAAELAAQFHAQKYGAPQAPQKE